MIGLAIDLMGDLAAGLVAESAASRLLYLAASPANLKRAPYQLRFYSAAVMLAQAAYLVSLA